MRTALLSAAALAVGLIGAAGSAEARQGCGIGFHRDIYGYCRPNLAPRPLVYPGIIYRPGFYAPIITAGTARAGTAGTVGRLTGPTAQPSDLVGCASVQSQRPRGREQGLGLLPSLNFSKSGFHHGDRLGPSPPPVRRRCPSCGGEPAR